jgi:hypothetical protein
MRLGAGDIEVTVGAVTSRLRPSLRAAFRLERDHGGFDKLIRAVAKGDWRAMSDVIAQSSEPPVRDYELARAITGIPLKDVVPPLTEPLLRHVFALAGIDPDKTTENAKGKRITFADYHTRLFRQATGWLGWTPDDAWKAAPAEIEEALAGRMEMLRAIFGSADKDAPFTPDKPDEATFDREGLANLKGKGRVR